MDIEKNERIFKLYEIYQGLLTTKQRAVMDMYLVYDNTLVEIAEENKVSRQAIHNIITDSTTQLYRYEMVLGLEKRNAELSDVADELNMCGMQKYAKRIANIVKNNKKT